MIIPIGLVKLKEVCIYDLPPFINIKYDSEYNYAVYIDDIKVLVERFSSNDESRLEWQLDISPEVKNRLLRNLYFNTVDRKNREIEIVEERFKE